MEETVATTLRSEAPAPIDATYRNLSTAELYEHAVRNCGVTVWRTSSTRAWPARMSP